MKLLARVATLIRLSARARIFEGILMHSALGWLGSQRFGSAEAPVLGYGDSAEAVSERRLGALHRRTLPRDVSRSSSAAPIEV